jgi:hypothetical protein
VTRGLLLLICAALLIVGCKRAPEDKEAVRQAVVEHLSKVAGLEMSQLDITVADVQFKGNEASAKVAIKPKTAPEQAMTMPYNLERRGNKWVVKPRSGGGHGGMGAMGGGMGATPAAPQTPPAGGEIPSGHPPVNSGGAKGGDLPSGHPPVNQAPPKK